MSAADLKAHRPDLDAPDVNTSNNTFRCDSATVRQVLDWWEQNPARAMDSQVAEAERRRIWNLLKIDMGDCLCLERRPFHLLTFINKQPRIKKNNTRRRWNTTIQQPFNEAEELGLILKNPFRGVHFLEGDEGRDWTDEEIAAVLEAASQAFGELIIGMRLSSLRPVEACELCWRQIRFKHGNIQLDQHKSRHATKKAAHIPLNDETIALFNLIRARNQPGERVFLTPKGRPWTRPHADHTFRLLREKLGLPDDLKMHGCRHTFATGAIMNDVGIMYLQKILRHADIRTTQRYVHLADDTKKLTPSMNQAVKGVKLLKRTEYTPLFDGLE